MTECFDNIESIRVLYDISTIIQSDMILEEKFQKALERVRKAAGCQSASLFIQDEETGQLNEVATVGKRVDLIESINFDLGKGFSAWVAKQRKSVLIPSLRKVRMDGLRSFVSTPLLSGDKLIGVLNLGHEKPDSFAEKDMDFLEIIASQIAHAIERSNYERMLVDKNAALESAREEIDKQHKQLVEMEKYRVLGQLAASINHEINNPLTTILGNIELLLMTNPEMNDVIRKKLTTVQSEARRIAVIVEKLRDMKKIVVEDYIDRYDETMIDISSSGDDASDNDEENLS